MAEIEKDLTTSDVHIATAIGTTNAQARRKKPKGDPPVDVSAIKEDEVDAEDLEKATPDYMQSLMEQAKSYLPDWLHREIHRRALPSSGGKATARKRREAALAALGATDNSVPEELGKGEDGLPLEVLLVEGVVSTRAGVQKGAAIPVAMHGRFTGRTFLLPGHAVYGPLRKAAEALGTALHYEGWLAQSHSMRPALYDLVLKRHGVLMTPPMTFTHRGARLVKSEPAQQKVWGVVMEPGRVDTQGDYEETGAIEKACHQFMQDYRLHKSNLGYSHERPMMDDECVLLENYCTPTACKIGGEAVPAGTWIQAWHIKAAPLWEKVVKGEMSGFSFGGTGVREPMAEATLPATLKRASAQGD